MELIVLQDVSTKYFEAWDKNNPGVKGYSKTAYAAVGTFFFIQADAHNSIPAKNRSELWDHTTTFDEIGRRICERQEEFGITVTLK